MKLFVFLTIFVLSSCDIGEHNCEDEDVSYLFDNQGVSGTTINFYFNNELIQHIEFEETDELICLCGNECDSSIEIHSQNFTAPLDADSVVLNLGNRYINFVSPRIDESKYEEQKTVSYFNPDNWMYAYEFQLTQNLFEDWGEER